MTLTLASQSPARKRILAMLLEARFPHLSFVTVPANLDERAHLRAAFPQLNFKRSIDLRVARRMAGVLATAKAKAVNREFTLGSDQLLFLPRATDGFGEILGKPGTHAAAVKMLKRCSGRTGYLITAVALLQNGVTRTETQVTRLQFSKLKHVQIDRILKLDQPYDCAGSFKFEEHGSVLFESVRTDDPTGIEGLPAMRVVRLLSFS